MSPIVTTGKLSPNGLPVCGLIDIGPVDPLQPPMTLEQITKNLSVSNALPGPMQSSHQPGASSSGELRPAAWALPDRAWQIKIALLRSALSWPYVSYASVIGPSVSPLSSCSGSFSANVKVC